ncbi:hypothetical protein OAP30_05815 [Nitrosopumilus sp.]|nr:hypothetical protein [Nitrosopumilus sp.]
MKPVFIIAIVAVAMIGVMVPSVFAQIEVTVTPYKTSYHIDEPNYLTVKVSKIIPNTTLCAEIPSIDWSGTVSLENSRNEGIVNLPRNYDSGNYQVRVFYGECNAENSFGNGYATIMFDKEPSNVTKFMQDNYLPEKTDVGLKFQSNENFVYHNIRNTGNVFHFHHTSDYWENRENVNSVFQQTWKKSDGTTQSIGHSVDILISTIKTINPDNYGSGETNGFSCTSILPLGGFYKDRYNAVVTCVKDSIYLQIRTFGEDFIHSDLDRRHTEQIELFLDVVTKKINSNPIPSQSILSSMYSTQSVDTTTSVDQWSSGDSLSIGNNECGKGTVLKNNVCVVELTCGKGTIEKNGQCVVDEKEGGGCLIATATYGSEMAPQVQQLRELRDNQLLQTESGTAFMGTFNDIYYSFSPIIADYERENPYFKEAVKIAITPMISSLSLMENAESESEVLSIGISVIMLNLGMYLGVPAIVIIGIRKIK